MKILTQDEIEAHRSHTLKGGIEGALAGFAISAIIFKCPTKKIPKIQAFDSNMVHKNRPLDHPSHGLDCYMCGGGLEQFRRYNVRIRFLLGRRTR